MEFWLIQDEKNFRFPVLPSEFNIPNEINVDTFNVENFGEISFIGKSKLSNISISSFFPNEKYNFCQYSNFPKPYECVKLIKDWQQSGKPIRFIITEADAIQGVRDVNMLCIIESFIYGEKYGDRDVYFTLELREYRIVEEGQGVNY
ncbi:hypothetical protein JMF89_05560 [Clostridiaceae bacterium UIB06]|uniref:Dit-like phage tail protein N-terminal domain-containing protein n=1 Tax=Clostridium thailandense TaxID=2794346 RepID=A0A949WX19_9CLOT|nr:hypothetical protein [Clostridium thailandense]MBV7275452.1 hypothetical protein [Clostridium thailandense]MCH5136687.1 hypothetical protein [Clostridiaceae bacterium UIB06]